MVKFQTPLVRTTRMNLRSGPDSHMLGEVMMIQNIQKKIFFSLVGGKEERKGEG